MAFDDTNKELLLYNTHLNVNFKESPTRANVKSGENISTSLGKIQKYLNDLGDAAFLDTDTAPTQNSTNPITSGAVYAALASKQDALSQAQLAAANSGITTEKLTADETALGEVINGGAAGTKNHCTQASGSNNPSSDRWINIPVSDVGVGQWIMSFGTLTSTDTDDTLCQAICFNSSSQQVSNLVNFKREANTNKVFTTTDNVAYVRLYAANSYATSAGDTVTFTNAMLCRKTLYDVNPEFEPYAPAKTNVEITPALVEVVDAGAKNEFDPASAWDSKTAYGVTVTRNGDTYSITSGTTQSGDNNFINMGYQANTNVIPAGDWVLSFDTPQQNVRLQVCWNGTLQANSSFGNSCFFTVPENTTDSWFRIILRGSTNMAGTSFKIMLCPRILWDISHKFVSYALPNPTLTPALIEQVDNGAKNHLYCDINVMHSANTNGTWSGNAFTHNSGVTFTINSDLSITVNGTASDVNGVFVLSTDFTISQGDWILSGTPTGGSSSTYNTTIAGVISDLGNTARFSSATNKLVRIYVLTGTTVNNLLFKPMVCSADDWAISHEYQPYRPSWQEMYDMILALQNGTRSAPALAMAEPEPIEEESR